MSIRRRFRKFCFWSMLLVAAIVAGGTVAAYQWATDSDTLKDLVEREAPKYLPKCKLGVLQVKVHPLLGKVSLYQLTVVEPGEAGASRGVEVVRVPYLQVRFDPWGMTKGRFEAREVAMVKPTLRLARRADGTWNLQGLLADPWPLPKGGPIPPIKIKDGIVELLGDEPGKPTVAILRDVQIETQATAGGGQPIAFVAEAKSEVFDRVDLEGTVDPTSGKLELTKGDLVRLTISDSLKGRLPSPADAILAQVGLTGGEVDASVRSMTFDPSASPPVHYDATLQLRRGVWECSKLPFPLSDVSVNVRAVDGRLTVERGTGINGSTSVDLSGSYSIRDDPDRSPFEIKAVVSDLELDGRLRKWTPEKPRELWDVYFPSVGEDPKTSAGRLNATLAASRPDGGGEIAFGADVTLLDVSMKYKHFAYPIDHIRGRIVCSPRKMVLQGVNSLVGGRPLVVNGTVINPGREAIADLKFEVESLPLDATLFQALPPEVRKVVADFKPTGTVKGVAQFHRDPPLTATDDPRGRVRFDSKIDLNPGCSVTWQGLQFPVLNLTGQLEIHPDQWIFRRMSGKNGQAVITADGRVDQVAKNLFQVGMELKADNLPFDQQLQGALPQSWQRAWTTLNPTGASDIHASIHIDPRLPRAERDHYRIEVRPRPRTGVNLRFNPLAGTEGPPGGMLELRMDEATGLFVYDTAVTPPTAMTDVGFNFQGAKVTFKRGQVDVQDSGAFALGVIGLDVSGLRLAEGVRKLMPPVMANFARRLDDRELTQMKGDLGLGWSGDPRASAWCRWENGMVLLVDNQVNIGTDVTLGHIQGQIDNVNGMFDGRDLEVHGKLNLASISVFDQQITGLTADLDISKNLASLDKVQGKVLEGTVVSRLKASLDATPKWSVAVSVEGADLHEYVRNLKGQQAIKGLVNGWFDLSGMGYDPHTISGQGEAKILQGDLGKLPVALRFLNVLKPRGSLSTAFDSAEVEFAVKYGETTLDPVRFLGNALSLDGRGTLDVRGELELQLRILAGRDKLHVPLLSDLTRELSGQILTVRVFGPVGAPSFKAEPLPATSEFFRQNHKKRQEAGALGPWRTGFEQRARDGLLR